MKTITKSSLMQEQKKQKEELKAMIKMLQKKIITTTKNALKPANLITKNK